MLVHANWSIILLDKIGHGTTRACIVDPALLGHFNLGETTVRWNAYVLQVKIEDKVYLLALCERRAPNEARTVLRDDSDR